MSANRPKRSTRAVVNYTEPKDKLGSVDDEDSNAAMDDVAEEEPAQKLGDRTRSRTESYGDLKDSDEEEEGDSAAREQPKKRLRKNIAAAPPNKPSSESDRTNKRPLKAIGKVELQQGRGPSRRSGRSRDKPAPKRVEFEDDDGSEEAEAELDDNLNDENADPMDTEGGSASEGPTDSGEESAEGDDSDDDDFETSRRGRGGASKKGAAKNGKVTKNKKKPPSIASFGFRKGVNKEKELEREFKAEAARSRGKERADRRAPKNAKNDGSSAPSGSRRSARSRGQLNYADPDSDADVKSEEDSEEHGCLVNSSSGSEGSGSGKAKTTGQLRRNNARATARRAADKGSSGAKGKKGGARAKAAKTEKEFREGSRRSGREGVRKNYDETALDRELKLLSDSDEEGSELGSEAEVDNAADDNTSDSRKAARTGTKGKQKSAKQPRSQKKDSEDEDESEEDASGEESEEGDDSSEEGDKEDPLRIQRILRSEEKTRREWRDLGRTMNTSHVTNGSIWKQPAEPEKRLDEKQTRFLIKWQNYSALHTSWETYSDLATLLGNQVKSQISRFLAKEEEGGEEDTPDTDWVEVDRVLDVIEMEGECTRLLIKWAGLPYGQASEEKVSDLEKAGVPYEQAVEHYRRREDVKARKARKQTRQKEAKWEKYEESPVFHNGGTLRDYQLEGVNWMVYNWTQGRGSILADEMGLGKTIQTATFLWLLQSHYGVQAPFLVVAPLSTITHWQREFQGWTGMNCVVYHGGQEDRHMINQYEIPFGCDRKKPINARTQHKGKPLHKIEVVVTTPEMCCNPDALRHLGNIKWSVLVVDEAHKLKNDASKLNTVLQSKYEYKHTLLLTGTPLQNSTEELWTLLNFIDRKQFKEKEEFSKKYGDMTQGSQVEELKEKIQPYMLRRVKEDVEKSVPPKEETIVEVELTTVQKQYYRAIYEQNTEFLMRGNKRAIDGPSLMNLAMELRKCCNHPYLIKGVEHALRDHRAGGTAAGKDEIDHMVDCSGKLVLLDKLLPRLQEQGHRVLIFSQFKIMLDILEDYLVGRGITFGRIDGSVTGRDRQRAIDKFQTPGVDMLAMLLSTKAGGVGITLTAADTCIIYDSDWNPQNDLQAQARCHRIGQTKSVKVYRLLTRKTYEMHMFQTASRKLGLDQALLKQHKPGEDRAPTKAEVEALLKHGAYDIFKEEQAGASAEESKRFCESDIDSILSRAKVITHEAEGGGQDGRPSSTFSKASFVANSGGNTGPSVDVDDPEFWTKVVGLSLPEKKQEQLGRRAAAGGKKMYTEHQPSSSSDNDSDASASEGEDSPQKGEQGGQDSWSMGDLERLYRAAYTIGYGYWDTMLKDVTEGERSSRTAADMQAAYCGLQATILKRLAMEDVRAQMEKLAKDRQEAAQAAAQQPPVEDPAPSPPGSPPPTADGALLDPSCKVMEGSGVKTAPPTPHADDDMPMEVSAVIPRPKPQVPGPTPGAPNHAGAPAKRRRETFGGDVAIALEGGPESLEAKARMYETELFQYYGKYTLLRVAFRAAFEAQGHSWDEQQGYDNRRPLFGFPDVTSMVSAVWTPRKMQQQRFMDTFPKQLDLKVKQMEELYVMKCIYDSLLEDHPEGVAQQGLAADGIPLHPHLPVVIQQEDIYTTSGPIACWRGPHDEWLIRAVARHGWPNATRVKLMRADPTLVWPTPGECDIPKDKELIKRVKQLVTFWRRAQDAQHSRRRAEAREAERQAREAELQARRADREALRQAIRHLGLPVESLLKNRQAEDPASLGGVSPRPLLPLTGPASPPRQQSGALAELRGGLNLTWEGLYRAARLAVPEDAEKRCLALFNHAKYLKVEHARHFHGLHAIQDQELSLTDGDTKTLMKKVHWATLARSKLLKACSGASDLEGFVAEVQSVLGRNNSPELSHQLDHLLPGWWRPGVHDVILLVAAARYGSSAYEAIQRDSTLAQVPVPRAPPATTQGGVAEDSNGVQPEQDIAGTGSGSSERAPGLKAEFGKLGDHTPVASPYQLRERLRALRQALAEPHKPVQSPGTLAPLFQPTQSAPHNPPKPPSANNAASPPLGNGATSTHFRPQSPKDLSIGASAGAPTKRLQPSVSAQARGTQPPLQKQGLLITFKPETESARPQTVSSPSPLANLLNGGGFVGPAPTKKPKAHRPPKEAGFPAVPQVQPLAVTTSTPVPSKPETFATLMEGVAVQPEAVPAALPVASPGTGSREPAEPEDGDEGVWNTAYALQSSSPSASPAAATSQGSGSPAALVRKAPWGSASASQVQTSPKRHKAHHDSKSPTKPPSSAVKGSSKSNAANMQRITHFLKPVGSA